MRSHLWLHKMESAIAFMVAQDGKCDRIYGCTRGKVRSLSFNAQDGKCDRVYRCRGEGAIAFIVAEEGITDIKESSALLMMQGRVLTTSNRYLHKLPRWQKVRSTLSVIPQS